MRAGRTGLPRTSWTSSVLHWTAQIDLDAQGVDWEFAGDRRPEETAALFAELGVKPLSQEEFGERKPGTCHPRRWCNHAWPCGRDFEAWQATQPKSKAQLRRERQEAARAANAEPAATEPERSAGDAHEHAAAWIEPRPLTPPAPPVVDVDAADTAGEAVLTLF